MSTVSSLTLPESRWADVGGPIHYREWEGPAAGPTFVCVHGLGGSHLNWAGVAPGLARRGRVLGPDLAGFGLTPPEGRRTDIGANWRLLHNFMGALGLPPAILVGNSMGGMLALIEAAHHPEDVQSLVLVDAAFPRPRAVATPFSPRVAAMFAVYSTGAMGERFAAARARRLGAEGLVRETFRLCAADPDSIDPALVAAHVEMTERRLMFDYAHRAFIDAARSIFTAQVSPGRYRALVQSVHAPALVIHGGLDRLVPIGAARMAAAGHTNWEMVAFPELGHIPQLEDPERWLATVESWLDATPHRVSPD